ncbi:MAG: peptidylprolyl isomerase, partial [Zoogloea sp.]|nr:peptidylprolyl isomerase [Zoogloea sp.]
MFDLVRNNKKFVQIFLLLITLPFAFWGVESYVRSAASDKAVAEVGGSPIRPVEFQQALREQQDRMRKTLGSNYNPAMLETPAARAAVLDNLINQRLLSLHAAKMRVSVSDQLLRDTIAGVPAFQENGQFSTRRYQAALQAQGMNEAMFESRVRQDLAFQQLIGAVADGSIAARASAERV